MPGAPQVAGGGAADATATVGAAAGLALPTRIEAMAFADEPAVGEALELGGALVGSVCAVLQAAANRAIDATVADHFMTTIGFLR